MPLDPTTDGGGLPTIKGGRRATGSTVKKSSLPNWGSLYNPMYNPPALPGVDGGAGLKPKSSKRELSKDTAAQAISRLGQMEYGDLATAAAVNDPSKRVRAENEGYIRMPEITSSRRPKPKPEEGMSEQAWFNVAANYTAQALRWARAAEGAGDVELWRQFMPNKMSAEMARTVFLSDKALQQAFAGLGGWYGFWQRYYTQDGLRRDLANAGSGGGGGDGGGGGRVRRSGGGGGGAGGDFFGAFNPYGPYVWKW